MVSFEAGRVRWGRERQRELGAGMKRGPTMNHAELDISDVLDDLRPFINRIATIRNPMERPFSGCLRSSVVKTFEFLTLASTATGNQSYFLTPVLRSIAEDIIFLSFLSSCPEREDGIRSVMANAVYSKIQVQQEFFSAHRPFQPVLSLHKGDEDAPSVSFWRNNGWPKLSKGTPPAREVASRCDNRVLEVVYDYIFRITSTAAHFSPQNLLRVGWGETDKKITFNYRNLAPYFSSVNLIYGSFLFCMYFDLFRRFLRPRQAERNAVRELERRIHAVFRWPEAVTFEEMNVSVPKIPISHVVAYVLHNSAYRRDAKGEKVEKE